MTSLDALRISRGNVTWVLKELQAWRLVQIANINRESVRIFFQANGSIWIWANVLKSAASGKWRPNLKFTGDILLDKPLIKTGVAMLSKNCKKYMTYLKGSLSGLAELQRLSPEKLNALMKQASGVGQGARP